MIISHIDSLKKKNHTVDYQRAREDSLGWVDNLGIKIGQIEDSVLTLSGGNQQKVILGKWLETSPKVLILNGPTIGVDIGAKYDIHQYLRNLATETDMAIILISDDIDEILNTCNRILIIKKGRITGQVFNSDIDEQYLKDMITDEEGGEVS